MAVGPPGRSAQLLELERPVGNSERGPEDLWSGYDEWWSLPPPLADALQPKPVLAWLWQTKLEPTAGTGDRSGALLAPVIQQDDERFGYRACIRVTNGVAEHLLPGEARSCQYETDCREVERLDHQWLDCREIG
jgi:hypothetical protein